MARKNVQRSVESEYRDRRPSTKAHHREHGRGASTLVATAAWADLGQFVTLASSSSSHASVVFFALHASDRIRETEGAYSAFR